MERKNLFFLFIVFGLIGLLIIFMPSIYKFTESFEKVEQPDIPKVEEQEVEKIEEITMDSEVISELNFPIMRNDIYSQDSYYQLKSLSVNDLTNNDILYNAFIDLYEGYMVDHGTVGCTNSSKEFSATYLVSRIKNVVGRDIKYTNESFIVPNYDVSAKYVGTWQYNQDSNSYIYYGDCNTNLGDTIYYDLTKLNKVETENDNAILYLYYSVAFAKLQKNENDYIYTMYGDANMNKEIKNGNISNIEQLDYIFEEYLKDNSTSNYKYTFKKGLCTYDNYCFYKGEWINE